MVGLVVALNYSSLFLESSAINSQRKITGEINGEYGGATTERNRT